MILGSILYGSRKLLKCIKVVKDVSWDGKLESVCEGHEIDEIRIRGRKYTRISCFYFKQEFVFTGIGMATFCIQWKPK